MSDKPVFEVSTVDELLNAAETSPAGTIIWCNPGLYVFGPQSLLWRPEVFIASSATNRAKFVFDGSINASSPEPKCCVELLPGTGTRSMQHIEITVGQSMSPAWKPIISAPIGVADGKFQDFGFLHLWDCNVSAQSDWLYANAAKIRIGARHCTVRTKWDMAYLNGHCTATVEHCDIESDRSAGAAGGYTANTTAQVYGEGSRLDVVGGNLAVTGKLNGYLGFVRDLACTIQISSETKVVLPHQTVFD